MNERRRGSHLLREIGERIGQEELLQIGINGLIGKEGEFERLTTRLVEFAQAFAVRFGPLLTGAEQRAGDAEKLGVKGATAFEHAVGAGVLGDDLLRGGNAVVGRHGVAEIFARADFFAQRLFLGGLLVHQFRIEQAGQSALSRLAAVLHAEEHFLCAARVLLAAPAVGEQVHLHAEKPLQGARHPGRSRASKPSSAIVKSRLVRPGWPETKTRSPSFVPLWLHLR